MNTDFASLERELKSSESMGHSSYDEPDYSDLADRYAVDDGDDDYDEEDLRRSS